MFIYESTTDKILKFNFNGNEIEFIGGFRKILRELANFCFNNGVVFDNTLTEQEVIDKISKTTFTRSSFHKLPNGEYLGGFDHATTKSALRLAKKWTEELNIKDLKIEESGSLIKKFGDIDTDEAKFDLGEDDFELVKNSMTFIEAAQYILKKNDNRPMTSYEVWGQSQDLVETKGQTPWDTMNAQMIIYSENSTAKGKKKNSLFRIIEGTRPYKFQLIDPDLEVQSIPDEDLDLPKTKAFDYPEDGVLPFTHFRGVQSQEEREKTEPVVSPFIDAICILGTSGKGKSTTTEMILDSIPNLEYEFIIPSASTTNLLAQFSPSSKSGGYVTSRLGKLIMKAHNNPTKNYIAVFDECHKANVIEMINDELLQCISTKRNRENRIISLDDEIAELYKGLKEYRGNLLIPDNFGFVFLSSKPDVITSNDDFFNRVEIYIMMDRPNEESIEDTFDYTTGKIKLKEPYFKHFNGKGKSDIDLIKTTFDSM